MEIDLAVLTSEEAAVLLRLNKRTVEKLLRQGLLPGAKVGKAWRIRRTDIDTYLRGEWSPRRQTR